MKRVNFSELGTRVFFPEHAKFKNFDADRSLNAWVTGSWPRDWPKAYVHLEKFDKAKRRIHGQLQELIENKVYALEKYRQGPKK